MNATHTSGGHGGTRTLNTAHTIHSQNPNPDVYKGTCLTLSTSSFCSLILSLSHYHSLYLPTEALLFNHLPQPRVNEHAHAATTSHPNRSRLESTSRSLPDPHQVEGESSC